ncbi:MAG: hypothetical protein ACRDMJ_00515, partial [Solirubrobacteraceae bacterium]
RAAQARARPFAKATGACPQQSRKPCYGTRDANVPSTGCKGVGGSVVSSGVASEFNGCGPQGGLDLIPNADFTKGDWVPDSPFGLASFFAACKGHDCCYGNCGSPKESCDSDFRLSMEAACQATWSGTSLLDSIGMSYCLTVANTYYNAVSSTQTGTDAFNAGQDEVCDCCVDCQTAIALTNSSCEAQHALTCPDPDNPGQYLCLAACGDSDNCGACGQTCPPKDNGDGSSQRGCCWDGGCTWEVGCLDYCSCWNQPGG